MNGYNYAEPLVRAQFCQEWLMRVAKEDDPWRERFRARISPATLAAIEGASRVAWVPLAIHVELSDALDAAFGATRAHDYYRRAFASALRGPLLGPLVQTGTRMLGVTPATFVRLAGRAYDASFKHAGRVAGEVLGEGRARMHYQGLPPVCTASDAWMSSPQASAYGAFDFLGVDGVVRLDHSRRAEGAFTLELDWIERKR